MRASHEQIEDYHKRFKEIYGNVHSNNREINFNEYLCKFWQCPDCESSKHPIRASVGVNKYTLFEEAIKCPDCGYVMRGFNYSELLFRMINQFTPLFSKPLDTDYKIEPDKYLNELYHSRELHKNYLGDFRLWKLGPRKFICRVDHVYISHLDIVNQQITYYRRKAWEYAARKHQVCFFCGSNENLEHHHIIPVSEGGDNSYQNLISLCFSCHKKVHRMRSMEHKMICSIA